MHGNTKHIPLHAGPCLPLLQNCTIFCWHLTSFLISVSVGARVCPILQLRVRVNMRMRMHVQANTCFWSATLSWQTKHMEWPGAARNTPEGRHLHASISLKRVHPCVQLARMGCPQTDRRCCLLHQVRGPALHSVMQHDVLERIAGIACQARADEALPHVLHYSPQNELPEEFKEVPLYAAKQG